MKNSPAGAGPGHSQQNPFVTYVVQNKLAKGRVIAELASDQFGVALLDLSALDKETLPKDLISEKLARQHRVLPLSRRGTKLYVAISDPANHQSIADIQFSTGLTIESILVEDDKLGEAIDKLYESGTTGQKIWVRSIWMASMSRPSTRMEKPRRVARPPMTRRSFASSTRCCSMRYVVAHPTCTSSPTKSLPRAAAHGWHSA